MCGMIDEHIYKSRNLILCLNENWTGTGTSIYKSRNLILCLNYK